MSKKVMQKIVSINKQTELSAEKVELGIVDDLNKTLNSSQQISKEITDLDDLIGKNMSLRRSIVKSMDRAEKEFKSAEDLRRKTERQFIDAKESFRKAEISYKGFIARKKETSQIIDGYVKKRKPLEKTARTNISLFDKMIDQAEKAAKDLGVKIPTASFSKMRDRLEKLIKVL
jgi:hypothetical protein